jgi:hypothetical protein
LVIKALDPDRYSSWNAGSGIEESGSEIRNRNNDQYKGGTSRNKGAKDRDRR